MYNTSFHKAIESDEYPQAVRIAEYISKYTKPARILDFGCSTGLYLRELKKTLPSVPSLGFEFSSDAVNNALCSDVIQCDLTTPLELDNCSNTLGICLEVLEHIDDLHHKEVLVNLTKYTNKLIFSAAHPGQGGTGHINCRPKLDWIKRFHDLGWVVDHDATQHFIDYMRSGYHMGWLRMNVIILAPAKESTS